MIPGLPLPFLVDSGNYLKGKEFSFWFLPRIELFHPPQVRGVGETVIG